MDRQWYSRWDYAKRLVGEWIVFGFFMIFAAAAAGIMWFGVCAFLAAGADQKDFEFPLMGKVEVKKGDGWWSYPHAQVIEDERPAVLIVENASVHQMLSKLSPALRSSIKDVKIWDDCPGFDENSERDPKHSEVFDAHCHAEKGRICIKTSLWQLDPTVIWHEAGHALTGEIERSGTTEFSQRVYLWKKGYRIPYNTWTNAERIEIHEAIADLTWECYKALNHQSSKLDNSEYALRHQPLLNILNEYGFFTGGDYDWLIAKKF